ncbi:NADP-dependent oxidoreductase [Parerythrobacter jejuensis]|uniref:Zinc-binding dehydrogenase n=1 Tax=Parerythrobacter jejuensis TaxID=795812 RepID=A0A845ATQ8_9SPHN|nr:NADP-dependent oxidoreductase [Parerythrobacter jejuensis]MXP30228.1 zinc-binding dehydrogenase [Parerythrobacter jejuensis]MXP32988.1 zinc-binding dehydrogenase [Parerythrobacter jejuensis]
MPTTARQWLLNGHPRGRGIEDGDFKLVETEIADPGEGEVLLKTHFLGFDPAQKGWMENIADYVAPMALGDVMRGSGISEVIASNHPKFHVGEFVFGSIGWTEYLVSNGEGLTKVETSLPPTAVLSVLGTTGVTAYCGLFKVGKPVAGDTVLVSGAAGATGSVVGQLAKIAGCRAVGIAGGPEKCKWLVEEAGYDAAIDYKAGGVKEQIKEHCPGGVDVIFDNVGGSILDDMLANIATGARVVICGGISRYETGDLPSGPKNYFNLIFRRASMAGFIVLDWAAEFPAIRKRLEGFVHDGSLSYQEDIQEGFENAPETLNRLFRGANRGKQMLKL